MVRFHLLSTFPFKELDHVALDHCTRPCAPSRHPRARRVGGTSCARHGAVFCFWRARLDLSGWWILRWIRQFVPVAVPLCATSCDVRCAFDSDREVDNGASPRSAASAARLLLGFDYWISWAWLSVLCDNRNGCSGPRSGLSAVTIGERSPSVPSRHGPHGSAVDLSREDFYPSPDRQLCQLTASAWVSRGTCARSHLKPCATMIS